MKIGSKKSDKKSPKWPNTFVAGKLLIFHFRNNPTQIEKIQLHKLCDICYRSYLACLTVFLMSRLKWIFTFELRNADMHLPIK